LQQSEAKPPPKGDAAGNFCIISSDALAKITGVKRLHNFIDIGVEPFEIFSTKSMYSCDFNLKLIADKASHYPQLCASEIA